MLYMSGIASRHKYAGTDSVISVKSMLTTVETIKNPTKMSAGAVAKFGMEQNSGERTMDTRNKNPVTTDARPVLAPSPTPEELSTKVVVVEVPSTAPAEVAIASANSAPLIFGSLPSLSNISALFATPIRVPSVSNISTNRKDNKIAIKSKILTEEKSAVKHLPKVLPIAVISVNPHTGYKE